ncbi:MAG: hypothetical protein ACOYB3_00975 [Azonexus sp.]
MLYIEPVSLPSGAGVNFGEGDVRHFSEGDAISVPGMSNPTRHLAARDILLAEKLNAVISEVNNKEQIIPLPVYRMVIPPITEEIVANHRIPNGYEARVLNATISSTPNSADIELNILWAEGFGNVSGTAVMTTTNESSGGTVFSPAGEFIVQVKNKGAVTLDVVASVMITMRPITDFAGALLPAATVAPAGPAGAKGDSGSKGDTGSTGPAGSPGLNFRQQWARLPYPITYQVNDVVTHDFSGTSARSSFVCLQGHIADGINMPQPALMPSPFWDFLAEAGSEGPVGGTGSAGSGVVFFTQPINGTVSTRANYVAQVPPWNTAYDNNTVVSASTLYYVPTIEVTASNPSGSPIGMAQLSGQWNLSFYGDIDIILPSIADNAATVDYTPQSIRCVAVPHGTEAATPWIGPEITPTSNGWNIHVRGSTPIPMQVAVFGSQIIL